MADALPIIPDIPHIQPGLGFAEYAEAVADAIRGGNPAQFTIGIYGPWGSGKSSLLNAVKKRLEEYPGEVTTVFFDAWRYEKSGAIIVPLLHAIHNEVQRGKNDRLRDQLRKTLRALLFSINITAPFVELDTQRLRAEAGGDADLTELDLAFTKPYQEMEAISRALAGQRIAVLIDDLDRCSPGSVVQLLEAINLVMHVPGLVFVLALDYDVLVEAVQHKYPHANGHKFIEKMVQVQFRVPQLALRSETFLHELIPDWNDRMAMLPPEFAEDAYVAASTALARNPRQIKRFVNSFLLLQRIVGRRKLQLNTRGLAGVVGLQIAWPEPYQRYLRAAVRGDDGLAELTKDATDTDLIDFAKHFLTGVDSPDIVQILLLAESVTGSADTSGLSFEELTAYTRERLVKQIGDRRFTLGSGAKHIYYPEEGTVKRTIRIRFTKNWVKFETLNRKGEWALDRDFPLYQDTSEPLAHLDKLLRT